jgi:hypothetical protein
MDGAEDLPEQLGVLRSLFEVGQAAFHPVQAFLAFDEELARQFIHVPSIEEIRF